MTNVSIKVTKKQIIEAIQTEKHLFAGEWIVGADDDWAHRGEGQRTKFCNVCAVGAVLKNSVRMDTPSWKIRNIAIINTSAGRYIMEGAGETELDAEVKRLLDRKLYLNALSCVFEGEWERATDRMRSESRHAHYRRIKKVKARTTEFVKKKFPAYITIALEDVFPRNPKMILD